jgi:hypothetical protein
LRNVPAPTCDNVKRTIKRARSANTAPVSLHVSDAADLIEIKISTGPFDLNMAVVNDACPARPDRPN